jgi:hypothetical protein
MTSFSCSVSRCPRRPYRAAFRHRPPSRTVVADFYSHSNERLQPSPNSRGGPFGRGILERVEPGQVHAISRADRAARRGTWSLACMPNAHAARAKNRFSSPTALTGRSSPCAVGHAWPLMERVRPLPGNRDRSNVRGGGGSILLIGIRCAGLQNCTSRCRQTLYQARGLQFCSLMCLL